MHLEDNLSWELGPTTKCIETVLGTKVGSLFANGLTLEYQIYLRY